MSETGPDRDDQSVRSLRHPENQTGDEGCLSLPGKAGSCDKTRLCKGKGIQ